MYKHNWYILLLLIVFGACTKEQSLETGLGLNAQAEGTLKDSTNGLCAGILVYGTYKPDSVLRDTHYVVVTATITKGGKYAIFSDTVNGIWFRDSSFVLNTGVQTFKLKGFGKPILPIDAVLNIQFANSNCFITVPCNGTSTNPSTPPVLSFGTETDYFPLVDGNFWVFDTDNGGIKDSVTGTVLSGTKVIGSNTYKVILSDTNDSAYVRKDGNGKYFQFANFGGNGSPVDYQFLDDRLGVGGRWQTQDIVAVSNGTPFTYKVVFTIIQKNVTTNINNITLDSVIRVEEDVQVKEPLSGTYISALKYNNFYAKKVGLVFWDLSTFIPPYTQKIKRWRLN